VPNLVRADAARFVLVEGLHRLEAAKALGEETIASFLVDAEGRARSFALADTRDGEQSHDGSLAILELGPRPLDLSILIDEIDNRGGGLLRLLLHDPMAGFLDDAACHIGGHETHVIGHLSAE
jgi:hypothetical protein